MPTSSRRSPSSASSPSRSVIRGSDSSGSPRSWHDPNGGGLGVSPNGVWKTLCRHGLNTRHKRLALVAGYRAPYEPPRPGEPDPKVETTRPGELVGIDCFYVGAPARHVRHRLADHRDRHLQLLNRQRRPNRLRAARPRTRARSRLSPPRGEGPGESSRRSHSFSKHWPTPAFSGSVSGAHPVQAFGRSEP